MWGYRVEEVPLAEFARRLQGKSPALALPLTWIEQRLSEDALTIEQMVQSENQQQAADQVSISNSIGSLRFLGADSYAGRLYLHNSDRLLVYDCAADTFTVTRFFPTARVA